MTDGNTDPRRTDSETTDSRRGTLARRGFLGASTAGLVSFAANGRVAGSEKPSDATDDHPPFAAIEHDHSGEYGEATRLGEHAPVESIDVDELRARAKPFRDVRAYGAEGDGRKDDTDAVLAAIEDTDEADAVFFPPGTYILSEPIEFADDERSLSLFGAGMGISVLEFVGEEGGIDAELSGPWNAADPQTFSVRALTLRTATGNDTAVAAGWPEYENSTQNATCTIERVSLQSAWSTGFDLYHAWNTRIDGVRGRGEEGSEVAIRLTGRCIDSIVENLVIYEYETGIEIGDDEELPTEGVHVQNGTLVGVDTGVVAGNGPWLTVTNTHVNAHEAGVVLKNRFQAHVSNCLLYKVNFSEEDFVGVKAENAEEVHVTNVTVNNTSETPSYNRGISFVRSSAGTIQGNTFMNLLSEGVGVEVDESNRVRVTDNAVTGMGRCVSLGSETVACTATGNIGLVEDEGTANAINGNIPITALLEQASHNTPAPGDLAADGTYGQSFTVEDGFVTIEPFTVNYGEPDSAATFTLYEGTPGDGLDEIDDVRVESVPADTYLSLSFSAESGGTYYLELSEPEKTPSWWWHQGDEGLVDVGGTAYANREPLEGTNVVFRVLGRIGH